VETGKGGGVSHPAIPVYDRLIEALDARGEARNRARAEVDRQFAAVIERLHREYAAANAAAAADFGGIAAAISAKTPMAAGDGAHIAVPITARD
jgi:hypothetical protein